MNKLLEMPAAEYHADPSPTPSLSASMAHTLLSRSPAHARLAHPRLGGVPRAATAAMEKGTLVHDMLLCGSQVAAEIIPADNYRTKAAQQQRDDALAAGLVPVLEREFAELLAVAAKLTAKLAEAGIAFDGQAEGVALWEERDDEGRPVPCRARLDHWRAPRIDDLKTTASARPKDCVRSIFEYGYATQAAAYLSAVEHLWPELAGRASFRFVFVELAEPCLFTAVELAGSALAVGRSQWRRAVNLWSRCLRTGEWPGYVEGVYRAEARPWDLRDELELTADANSLTPFLD
jgi:hypothetical protein